MIVLLDTGILGAVTHPRSHPESDGCKDWLIRISGAGLLPAVPEICDYELRRELVRAKAPGVQRLDQLRAELIFLPITSDVMLKAAELWALARAEGKSISDPASAWR